MQKISPGGFQLGDGGWVTRGPGGWKSRHECLQPFCEGIRDVSQGCQFKFFDSLQALVWNRYTVFDLLYLGIVWNIVGV
jgi:hypothetical protein